MIIFSFILNTILVCVYVCVWRQTLCCWEDWKIRIFSINPKGVNLNVVSRQIGIHKSFSKEDDSMMHSQINKGEQKYEMIDVYIGALNIILERY